MKTAAPPCSPPRLRTMRRLKGLYAEPAAILYQSALNDQAITVADAVRYQRAGSEPKNIMWYDTDHWLNEQAYFDQQVWLKRYIGIGSGN